MPWRCSVRARRHDGFLLLSVCAPKPGQTFRDAHCTARPDHARTNESWTASWRDRYFRPTNEIGREAGVRSYGYTGRRHTLTSWEAGLEAKAGSS
jgi:hypothetical protein